MRYGDDAGRRLKPNAPEKSGATFQTRFLVASLRQPSADLTLRLLRFQLLKPVPLTRSTLHSPQAKLEFE
jgi:hypothetical protein